jgi:hypothetical protein
MKKNALKKSIEKHFNGILSRIKKSPGDAVAMTFNILIREEDNLFVAHCLELDIVATAKTLDQVQKDIIDLIDTQVDYAFSNNNLENLFRSAPPEIWEIFFSCKEQIEKKHQVKSLFNKDESLVKFIPPWIITKTCLALQPCHV